MQLIERVREIGTEESMISEDSVRNARQAVRQEIARSARPERKNRRGSAWAGLGIGGLVAGAAVTAFVVGSVVAPPSTPAASAAEVLNAAAEGAIKAGDITIPAGKYLLIRSDRESLKYWDADMPVDAGEEWVRFNNANRADAEAALLKSHITSLYVPADRAEEWVSVSEAPENTKVFGDRAEEALADAAIHPGRPDADGTETLRVAGGTREVPDGQDGEGMVVSDLDGRRSWAEMPAGDPRELLTWMRDRVGESADSAASDSSIVEQLIDDPSLPLAPAELRSTILGTLALLDGSSVRSVDGDVTTIRFEWSTKWWTAWRDIEIDTARGLIVGVTDSGALTGDESAINGLPGWQSRTTHEVSVVDSAP